MCSTRVPKLTPLLGSCLCVSMAPGWGHCWSCLGRRTSATGHCSFPVDCCRCWVHSHWFKCHGIVCQL